MQFTKKSIYKRVLIYTTDRIVALIACVCLFVNVKVDLNVTVRPGPIRKHNLTANTKIRTIFRLGLIPFRQKDRPLKS